MRNGGSHSSLDVDLRHGISIRPVVGYPTRLGKNFELKIGMQVGPRGVKTCAKFEPVPWASFGEKPGARWLLCAILRCTTQRLGDIQKLLFGVQAVCM